MDKKLKDPIYGYINIPVDYMKKVIDTAVFQRLRRIAQTSYAPLYASAVHNRFVHSIGVFYLGSIVAEVLVDDAGFTKDIPPEESKATAPHEIMSCIVGIKEFSELLENREDRPEKNGFIRKRRNQTVIL